jgi:Phage integrase, N-terminal SAM-like domain
MSEEPTKAVSPLRQRMLDDMRMRKLSDKTQIAYIRAVRRLVRFLGRSPDTATAEDVRRFQLHLVDRDCEEAARAGRPGRGPQQWPPLESNPRRSPRKATSGSQILIC